MHVSAASISGATCRRHSYWLFLLAVLFFAATNAAMMRQSTAFLLRASPRLQLATQLRTAAHGRVGALSVLGRRAFGVFKPFSDDLEGKSSAKLKAAPDAAPVLDWLKNAQFAQSTQLVSLDEDSAKPKRKAGTTKEAKGKARPAQKAGKAKRPERQSGAKKLQAKDRLKQEMAAQDPYFRLRGVLDYNPHVCSGCGTPYQSKDEHAPGFLPKEKMHEQLQNAAEFKEHREKAKILELAGVDIASPEGKELLRTAGMTDEQIASFLFTLGHYEEAEALQLRTQSSGAPSTTAREIEQFVQTDSFEQLSAFHDTEHLTASPSAEQDETELIELAAQGSLPDYSIPRAHPSQGGTTSVKDYGIRTICQRCHKLQHQSTVHDSLRPGWSDHEFLTPQRFVQLLEGVKEKKCVVLLLVDLFDLQGSILRDVREIAGDNEVIVAANKVDLLPKDASHERVISYVHQLVKSECGFTSPRTVNEVRHDRAHGRLRYIDEDAEAVLPRSNVHLVSCKTGAGFDELIRNVMVRARHAGGLVYVLGTANVGKSTFINQMLAKAYEGKSKRRTPAATVSSLPGTTLDMLKIALPTGIVVYDTPGILNPSQLTTKLTFEELKAVMPSKPLKPVTLRVTEGKCVCIGALAKVELAEGKPFFLTFFASPEIQLHLTASEHADAFLDSHAGRKITPPFHPERRSMLPLNQTEEFEIEGKGWEMASKDIVIAGLGWVSVTGAGSCKIRVSVPEGTRVDTRDALMPFDTWQHMSVYTGTSIRKTAPPKKH